MGMLASWYSSLSHWSQPFLFERGVLQAKCQWVIYAFNNIGFLTPLSSLIPSVCFVYVRRQIQNHTRAGE